MARVWVQYQALIISRPIVATVYLPPNDRKNFTDFLDQTDLPERLHFVRFNTRNPKVYPYNKLRNISIKRVKTSHFWVADMDMWPSCILFLFDRLTACIANTYDVLRSLPEHVLSNDFMAIIVPAFEYKKLRNCNEFISCVKRYHFSTFSIGFSVIPHLPTTKPELIGCIDQQLCQQFRPTAWVHVFLGI